MKDISRIILILFVMIITSTITFAQQNSKSNPDITAAKQVLTIMKTQILNLAQSFHNQTMKFKGQYEGQTKQIIDGYKKQIQQLKQELSGVETSLSELSSQLEKQAKENDANLKTQYQDLTKNLEESIKKLDNKLDSLSKVN